MRPVRKVHVSSTLHSSICTHKRDSNYLKARPKRIRHATRRKKRHTLGGRSRIEGHGLLSPLLKEEFHDDDEEEEDMFFSLVSVLIVCSGGNTSKSSFGENEFSLCVIE